MDGMDATDAILMLDIAARILAVTEFITGLLSAPPTPQSQQPASKTDEDEQSILAVFRNLRSRLLDFQIPFGTQCSSASPRRPYSHTALLRDVISSRDDSVELLDDIISLLRLSIEESGMSPMGADARTCSRLRLPGTLYLERSRRLSQKMTQQVSLTLSSRISELSRTLESSETERQYTRPEHESRIETMSSDLEELKWQFGQHLANENTNSSATVTEAIVKQFKDRLARLTESNNALLADRIVSSLNYDSRPVRHDSVLQAHKDTFQWAFDSRLSDWLSSESGVFWVSGKPGSGKSTFIKFIAKSPRTKELLGKWAGSPEKLAIATHFFWIAGTPIQKSWQGLLQSLLYDLLRGHPDVVSLTSPDRWEAAKAGQWQMAAAPWSVDELAVALRALASASCVPLKMCFFIDGLDEYDSDHAELCRVLRDLASSTHIKICLSSRRWSVFEQSFGNGSYQNLDIHELTRDDIRKFVSDQLDIKSRWNVEMSQDVDDEMTQLVDRIAAQACGVFLWAFFVTRSLREDISNGEDFGGLTRRLSQLPSDLDQLFQHMLETVDPFDHSKMAGFLQAAAHALEPLHIDLYWHLERELEGHGFGSRSAIVVTTVEDIRARREQTIRSINEKTKGLLRLVDNRVEFLHRTVKDFVLTKDVGEYLRSKLPTNYDGFISIAAAYLGFLRTKRTGNQLVADVIRHGRGMNSGPFIAHLNQALVYASEAAKQAGRSHTPQNRQVEDLLDEYEAAIESMVSLGHIHVKGVNSRGCHPKLIFREELLRHDLTPYLARKIRQHPDFFDMFDESPLFAALMPMCRSSGESSSPVPGVLDLLLQRGEDPNVQPRQRVAANEDDAPSPWVLFARSTMSVFNMLSGPCMFPALRWNESLKDATFGRLMSYGADPNMPLLGRLAARTVVSHFLDISLSKFLGEECFEDYLGTLDAFLRAGASLGVPDLEGKVDPDAGTAFGNLARRRPEESVLASFCSELRGLMARLAAEPRRALFVSLVVEKLAIHCCQEEDLRELEHAVSQGCSDHTAAPLLCLIASKIMGCKDQGSLRKRRQNADYDWQFSIKRVRRV